MKLKISLVLVTTIIGAALYWLSSLVPVRQGFLALERHAEAIASVYSGYAFTVAGFLATIATFLYTLGGKPYFELYRRRGHFGDLMLFHGLTMLVLASLFVVSILMHITPSLVRLASVLTALSLFQLTVLTLISYTLSNRSQEG